MYLGELSVSTLISRSSHVMVVFAVFLLLLLSSMPMCAGIGSTRLGVDVFFILFSFVNLRHSHRCSFE